MYIFDTHTHAAHAPHTHKTDMPSTHYIYICARSLVIVLAYAAVLALFALSFENAARLVSWDSGLCRANFTAYTPPPVPDTDPLKLFTLD